KLILMIAAASTLIVALLFSNSQPENRPISKISSNVPKEMKKNSEPKANNQVQLTDPPFKLIESLPSFTHIFPEVNQFFTTASDILKVQEKLNLIKAPIPPIVDEYVFPKLTEEEIKANNKRKKAMLKALEKLDRKIYTFLLSGSFDYLGEMTSVQAFLIQKTEVSNLEYRTRSKRGVFESKTRSKPVDPIGRAKQPNERTLFLTFCIQSFSCSKY
ncbi:MAG: hypothetical protein RL265_1215, partial [Bacteroidota bacterium]